MLNFPHCDRLMYLLQRLISPGEFGTELLISSLCLRLRTVLSDSVDDWISKVKGCCCWFAQVCWSWSLAFVRSFSTSSRICSSSSSTISSVLSMAESCASLIDSGIHCSSVVSLQKKSTHFRGFPSSKILREINFAHFRVSKIRHFSCFLMVWI